MNTVHPTMSSESHNQSFENHTFEHLEHLVSMQGFKIVDVESDGNCFYYAVEKQLKLLNLPNMTHTKLRQNLASYLEKENHTNKAYRPNAHLLYIVMHYNGIYNVTLLL